MRAILKVSKTSFCCCRAAKRSYHYMSDPSVLPSFQAEQHPSSDLSRPWVHHYEQGVPTNPLYTGGEMQYQLAESGARVIVMLDMFYPVVRAVRAKTSLEHVVITSPADYLPPLLRTLYPLSQRNAKHREPRLTEKELRE